MAGGEHLSESESNGMDRISPTLRPGGKPVMKQRWHDLLFLHWEVEPEALARHLPSGISVDTFEGKAYVGLVPFGMTDVRPVWAPSFPPLSNFLEINVRTYVHREGADPGVWFFSLDAANLVAVQIARSKWRLPYFSARMTLERKPSVEAMGSEPRTSAENTIFYQSERKGSAPGSAMCRVEYTPLATIQPAVPGTLEHFLVERYILYAYRKERLWSGQVHHAAYPVQQAEVHALQETLVEAAGVVHGNESPLAHYAREVVVDIYPLKPIL